MTPKFSGKLDKISEHDHHFKRMEHDNLLEYKSVLHGTRRIGVAIVGVGRMGVIHLYNALSEPRAKLLYLVDASEERLSRMASKFFLDERGCQAVGMDRWQEVLNDQSVELVIVATNTATHEGIVRSALEHDKNVLCEKPLSQSYEAIKDLVGLASRKKLELVIALQRRYDPHFKRIKEQYFRGDIGPARIIKTTSRDSPEPPYEYLRTSGGIWHDCGVHDVDCILWIAVELPYEVNAFGHAFGKSYRSLNDYDTACFSMRFPSGLFSVSDLSRISAAGYEQRIEVYGHKGVLKLDEVNTANWEKHTEVGVIKPGQCYSFSSRYKEAYRNELLDAINKVEGCPHMDQRNERYQACLWRIVHALEESAKSGKSVKVEYEYDCFAGMRGIDPEGELCAYSA